jgi:hypothetical protein
VFTTRSSIPTNNFTIFISSASASYGAFAPDLQLCARGLTEGYRRPYRDGSSDAALIGGVVGGVGGALFLLCLLLLLLAIIAVSRRRRSAYRKLKQPDFEAIAFGDVKEDVVLPKKQMEVSPSPLLSAL